MGRRRAERAPKGPKPKPVNYDIIPDDHPAYKLLRDVRNKWHQDMYDARIALAWRKKMKADVDGHVKLGHCTKVGDLQKEFMPYDFVIVLNRDMWETLQQSQHLALLDHEMCHATLSLNADTGERKEDEKGRTVYRVRKHDIEEFKSVVEHHGLYKSDLERFAKAILAKQATPLLAGLEPAPRVDGVKEAIADLVAPIAKGGGIRSRGRAQYPEVD